MVLIKSAGDSSSTEKVVPFPPLFRWPHLLFNPQCNHTRGTTYISHGPGRSFWIDNPVVLALRPIPTPPAFHYALDAVQIGAVFDLPRSFDLAPHQLSTPVVFVKGRGFPSGFSVHLRCPSLLFGDQIVAGLSRLSFGGPDSPPGSLLLRRPVSANEYGDQPFCRPFDLTRC